jgi:hypothetical protein
LTFSALLAFVSVALGSVPAMADPSTTSPQQGYDLGGIQSTREMAMGGALTALGTSTTALYDNPASLPFAKVYHFEALGQFSPEARRYSAGGAVADSVTNRLCGGFAGAYSVMDGDGINRQWVDLRLSLAYPLTDWLSIGLAGRYLSAKQSVGRGPFGSSLLSDGTSDGPLWSGFTIDGGLTVQPVTGLRIGAVGKNLTNPNNGVAPTTVAGGIGYTSDVFSIEADSLVDFSTWGTTRPRFGAGAEVFLVNRLALRAGYRFDVGQRVHALTFGAGYIDKKFGIEASVRRDIVADHPMTLMALAVRYFYDAGGPSDTVGQME